MSGADTGCHSFCGVSSMELMMSGVKTSWLLFTTSMKLSSSTFWKGIKFASIRLQTKLLFLV